MNDPFRTEAVPGFRLHKLEVYNWGTFDSPHGEVHTVHPTGQTTLLIGQNGSGKSTLVDALLTLLVRPVVRNYNVAAGAHKQERDERTYIRGAFGRSSRGEDNRAQVQFLRSAGANYSALLACFKNEATSRAFTVAIVLHLSSEGKAEKVYCFAPEERSIAPDLSRLESMDRLRQKIEKRGFRATTSYADYHAWFVKATGVRPRAMDVFNQTVAVKDIQSLNRFIRDHMLEAKPWGEKVESLLRHFTLLSEAHQSLVRVRRQSELLEPLAAAGAAYHERQACLDRAQQLLGAADAFFRQKTVELFEPECDRVRAELDSIREKKEQRSLELVDAQEECRRLTNEIENAGGERLRQIPFLIRQHETLAETRRESARRYREALRSASLSDDVPDAETFVVVQARLQEMLRDLEAQAAHSDHTRNHLVVERATTSRALRDEEQELVGLNGRGGNLPENQSSLRGRICEDLDIPESELPFVAELLAIAPEERDWQATIEMILRSFALNLLVPERHYGVVSRYINETRLQNARGQGQKLVYRKVAERSVGPASAPQAQSLIRKLLFRPQHPLVPWLRAELAHSFDYRCCNTLEEFQQATGQAATRERHIRSHGSRHEKNDRDDATDPRRFVLGWDNREKRRHLTEEIHKLQRQRESLDVQLQALDTELTMLRVRQTGVSRAQEVSDFTAIDHATPEREVSALRQEKRQLEESDNTIRHLKTRLIAANSRVMWVQAARDAVVRQEAELARQLGDAERMIANARQRLAHLQPNDHPETFADIEASFGDGALTVVNLFDQERAFLDARRSDLDRLRVEVEPLKTELLKLMNRYLREFPDERTELEADGSFLDGFLAQRDHIRREDLPRHEQRFKERLNEKVTQEIGLLHGAFQSERAEIVARIDQLNASLRQLEYRPGTHMRLEPRAVRDVEMVEFQMALRECLSDTFRGTLDADEMRFLHIEKLITRLRDDERWREKVTDVRRWFDFAARELENATETERGYYEDTTGQSGGEKAKLAFTILVAAIAYQYDLSLEQPTDDRFHFVVVDEMFSKVDDQHAEYALELFRRFGLQLLIVAPLDAKALVTEPYVGCYLHVIKDLHTNRSEVFGLTAREFQEAVATDADDGGAFTEELKRRRPR
jgi:uncharacterized protein YPO0396